MIDKGFIVLETGETFPGRFLGGQSRSGEVVFNTSHSGYEEIATDPSYFRQIMVCTAPQQGNYGVSVDSCESSNIWIQGFVCLEMYQGTEHTSWLRRLTDNGVPVLSEVDTRSLVLKLRDRGTQMGAIVQAKNATEAQALALPLMQKTTSISGDWTFEVSRKKIENLSGELKNGPRVAVIDFGCKNNILRELQKRCSEIRIFPSRSSIEAIEAWSPDGILLSNGPGDPENVEASVDTIRQLLGRRFIFGICMGHQLLARAVGGRTYKLKFGHRGSNHPIRDEILNKVYVSSQNHGYAVDAKSLPKDVRVTHTNLNDQTVAGMMSDVQNFMSVQFHPESHPGTHDAAELFDYFVRRLR